MISLTTLAIIGTVAFVTAIVVYKKLVIVGGPGDWVIRIRNGKLLNSGIGIVLLRRPWETVARFTAAMQRVAFTAEALSKENLPVAVDGFILWSVSPEGDNPLLAYSKLGIVDQRQRKDRDDASRNHLLTKPQYRAFQQIIRANIELHTAKFSLNDLIVNQAAFVDRLTAELDKLTEVMGVKIDELKILKIRPTDPKILQNLSTSFEEKTREEAAKARLETEERIKRLEVESSTQLKQDEYAALRDREIAKARARLEAEQQKAGLLEAEHEAKQKEKEFEQRLALLEVQNNVKLDLAKEEAAAKIQAANLAREEAAFSAKLEQTKKSAAAERDSINMVSEAQEAKSEALRDYELAHLVATKMAEALGKLPIDNAQWITVGEQSPAQTIASLLAAGRTLIGSRSMRS